MNTLPLYNLYLNRFLGDFVPVMPIIGLLLLSKNLTLSEISLFLFVFSLSVLVFELPGGILADRASLRSVIIFSRLCKLLAFTILLFSTSLLYILVAAFVWGLASAMDSGASQAYSYKLIQRLNMENEFEKKYSNLFLASLSGLLISALIATQVEIIRFDALQYIGIISLILCLISSIYLPTLSKNDSIKTSVGLTTVLKNITPILLVVLSIGILAGGIKGSLDEYTTLLLENKDVSYTLIGYAVFAFEVLKSLGAAISSRFKITIRKQIFLLLLLGTAFTAISTSTIEVIVLLLILTIFFDAILWVHNDVAIQRLATDQNRATLASVKNFGTEVVALTIFLFAWTSGENSEVTSIYYVGGITLILLSVIIFFSYHNTKDPTVVAVNN